MRTPQQAQYDRDRTTLKHYLIGRDYAEALGAMGLAEKWHIGFRKDNVTPELHHQISVCFNFLNTPIRATALSGVIEEAAISALILHDLPEDYPVTFDDLKRHSCPLTQRLVKGLTKVNGETLDQFFDRLLDHWLLPILKACDRDNNVMTMQGAFTILKMKSYIRETRTHILALLKKASNIFPVHHRSYSALATGIKKQLRIYEGFIKALEEQTESHAQLVREHACMTAQLRVRSTLAERNVECGQKIDELLVINEKLRAQIKELQRMPVLPPSTLASANESDCQQQPLTAISLGATQSLSETEPS
jgi:(p)ppGpp synthase/HD superfamily hydrolase